MGTSKRESDGRKSRWHQHNADRRQGILDAALTALARADIDGSGINVQQIANEAGVHRTVLYRYFEDRTDLDVAIQREICDRARTSLLASVTLEGTPRRITHRIVRAYVDWAVENRALMRFAERDIVGASSKPLDEAINQIAEQIELIIGAFLSIIDAELTDNDRAGLTPYVFLLVGGVISGVRSWTSRPQLQPPTADFTRLLAHVTWLQIEGLAQTRSIAIPDLPVEQLLNLKETP